MSRPKAKLILFLIILSDRYEDSKIVLISIINSSYSGRISAFLFLQNQGIYKMHKNSLKTSKYNIYNSG